MKLILKDLSIGHDRVLCSDINLSFCVGKVHVLMGSNGLGKTTLFRTIAGGCKALNGEVEFEDDLSGFKKEGFKKDGISSKIAFLGTERPTIDYLSVKDFLSFGFISSSDKYCNQLLVRFELNSYQNSVISELSDGQFKKLSLIRQLLKRPKVLLLDEPSAYLDISNKVFLVDVLSELKQECILIVSTHDVDFARKCGDEFYELKNQKLLKTLS